MSTNQTAKAKLKAEALSAVYQITKQSLEPPSDITCSSCIRATKNEVHPLETKDLSRTHSQTHAYTRALRSAVIHLSLIPTCQTTPTTASAPPERWQLSNDWQRLFRWYRRSQATTGIYKMPLKCHFCCFETCSHSHPHIVFLKQRPALKSSTIFDIRRLWMSQRPQLLKLLTSERDGVVWQRFWWMLLLHVITLYTDMHTKCIGFAWFFFFLLWEQIRVWKRTKVSLCVHSAAMCWVTTASNIGVSPY